MLHYANMDRERLLRISERVVLTVGAVALAAAGLEGLRTTSGLNDSEQLIPVPCVSPMPWESNNQAVEIVLASVKKPEPTPNRNKPECWQIVSNSITVFPQPSEQ